MNALLIGASQVFLNCKVQARTFSNLPAVTRPHQGIQVVQRTATSFLPFKRIC